MKLVKHHDFKSLPDYSLILILLVLGLGVRLLFYFGHVFSDDAYYTQLALKIIEGDSIESYVGYPIFKLRLAHVTLLVLSFKLFGISEFAESLPSLFFSLLTIVFVYKISMLLFKQKNTAFYASLLLVMFPTDVVFASINFTDIACSSLITIGLYFTILSLQKSDSRHAIAGGLLFAASILFKEYLLYVILVLLLAVVYPPKYVNSRKNLFINLSIVFSFFLIESLIYLFIQGDFFYRLQVLGLNFEQCYYDFFPFTKLSEPYSTTDYIKALFQQIFIDNTKYVFLRRFNLFIPLAALVLVLYDMKKGKTNIINSWFLTITLLMMSFTTSLSLYVPLDLRRSWYIFPIIMPAVIIVANKIVGLKIYYRIPLLLLYICGSLIMINEYREFFAINELNRFKEQVRNLDSVQVITDHHTEGSIKLLKPSSAIILRNANDELNFKTDSSESVIVYNPVIVDELVKQGYHYDFESLLRKSEVTRRLSFGNYSVYRVDD